MPSRTRIPLVLAGLVAALGLGVGSARPRIALLDEGSPTVVRQVTVGGSEPLPRTALTIGEIYDRASKAVVEIAVAAGGSSFGDRQTRAQGSGFVFDRRGHIVTNQHVVSDDGSISVSFWNGTVFAGELVGTDPSTDLAVIKVDAPASLLEPLRLANSSGVAVGDRCLRWGARSASREPSRAESSARCTDR